MTSMAVSARAASRPPPRRRRLLVVDSSHCSRNFSPAPKPPRGADVPVRPRPAELGRRRREPSSEHPPGVRRVPRLSRARGRLPIRTLPPRRRILAPIARPRRSVPPPARHAELRPGTIPAQLLVRHRRAQRRGSRRRTRPTRGRLPRRARVFRVLRSDVSGRRGLPLRSVAAGPGRVDQRRRPDRLAPVPGTGRRQGGPPRASDDARAVLPALHRVRG